MHPRGSASVVRFAVSVINSSPAAASPLGSGQRIKRRRSSAGPVAPNRPQRPREAFTPPNRPGGSRPTFLTLRDHGKVYVADLPRLSDGQLARICREAREVLDSLGRRLEELQGQGFLSQADQDTRIRAGTKREVTERFLRAIEEEQELRRSNPALRAAAGESVARVFLELARHRLPGATFDALLQEALQACGPDGADPQPRPAAELISVPRPKAMPVVLTPAPQAC